MMPFAELMHARTHTFRTRCMQTVFCAVSDQMAGRSVRCMQPVRPPSHIEYTNLEWGRLSQYRMFDDSSVQSPGDEEGKWNAKIRVEA